MTDDVAYTLAAAGIASLGWLISWLCLRNEHRRPPPSTLFEADLRRRQLDREVDESHAIRWRR